MPLFSVCSSQGSPTSRDAYSVAATVSPLSVFDQSLEEDPQVNRLKDSMLLWAAICSSKLLAETQLILFLNKCDLLERKLKRGVKLADYVPSYGDRPNDVMSVIKCEHYIHFDQV